MEEKEKLISIKNILPGDYQLHIFIEETRGLTLPAKDTLDPIIRLKAFSQTKLTNHKDCIGTSALFWGEHYFFDAKFNSFYEFEYQKLLISVLDHKTLGFNALIGEFELDLVSIYFAEQHTIKHQWLSLVNPKRDTHKTFGFIKISCSCTGPKDEQIPLVEESNDEKQKIKQLFSLTSLNEDNEGVLLPPSIRNKGWQIEIELIKAENLVKMDIVGTIDAYVVFEFGGARYQSKAIKNNINPFWNLKIKIPFWVPTINEFLTMRLMDADFGKKDDIVGTIAFSLNDIKNDKYMNYFWCNIYGSNPISKNQSNSLLMDQNSALGSYWKGRIYLKIISYEEEFPILSSPEKEETLSQQIQDQTNSKENIGWNLTADLFYGIDFPDSKKYGVKIKWAEHELLFKDIDSDGGVYKYFERKKIICNTPYNKGEFPDIFIYLMEGKLPICYVRGNPINMNKDNFYYYFKPDKSIRTDLKFNKCGVVKVRLEINRTDKRDDQIRTEKLIEPKFNNGLMLAHIYHAENLIAGDNDGNSDPYVKISYYGRELTSRTILKSLNPVWYETYFIDKIPFFLDKKEMPPILINIFDKDLIGSDYIGGTILNFEEGEKEGWIKRWEKPSNQITWPKPHWKKLFYNNMENCGKILISFQFFNFSIDVKNYELSLPLERYYIDIHLLGLRNLKSLGLLPVSRPFIKFNIEGLKIKSAEFSNEKTSIQTIPKECGSNANISDVISFEILLPKDPYLCPSLNCAVHDYLLKGLSQSILGYFSISFPDFIKRTHDKIEKKLSITSLKPEAIKLNIEETKEILINENLDIENDRFLYGSLNIQMSELQSALNGSRHEYILPQRPFKLLCKENLYGSNNIILSENFVISAFYEFEEGDNIYKEKNTQDAKLFLPLGYDSQFSRRSLQSKHYRHFLECELEKSCLIDPSPFDEFKIKRGKRINGDTFFSSVEKEVGEVKGWVSICSKTYKDKKIEKKEVSGISIAKRIKNDLIEKKLYFLRVYILDAHNLTPMDIDSPSDPYLKLILGRETQDNRKQYQLNKVNCSFHKVFEFKTYFPGCSLLKIQVWDYDDFVPDDLIGETCIDLENRFYSKKYRNLKHQPVETRSLKHPLYNSGRGEIRLWIDIFDLAKIPPPFNIQRKPAGKFELRVVIWEVDEVPSMDVEDCSDLYVVANFRGKKQATDVHYRAQQGYGSFNWRMIWDLDVDDQVGDYYLTFQVWDKDLLSADDYAGEGGINFSKEAKESWEEDIPKKMRKDVDLKKVPAFKKAIGKLAALKLKRKEEEKILLKMQKCNEKNQILERGVLMISLEILPIEKAKENAVGKGRESPNHSPWLPPPTGRFEWSANPWKLFTRCVGPKARRKVCMLICVILCTIILIFMAPIVIGNLLSDLLLKI